MLLVFASFLTTFPSLAGPSLARAASDPQTDVLTISLPENRLGNSAPNGSITSSAFQTSSTWKGVEFAVSTWSPHLLRLDTQVRESTTFSSGAFPALSVNFLFSQENLGVLNPGPLRIGEITPVLGATFLHMSRSGKLIYSGREEKVEQSLVLIPMRIGGRLSLHALRAHHLIPYFGLSLLPTVALASRSALGDGAPTVGLPVEIALGTELSLAGTPIDLGLVSTLGKLPTRTESGDFFGIGLHLGLRIGS